MTGFFWREDFPEDAKEAREAKVRVLDYWKSIHRSIGEDSDAADLYSELSLLTKHLNQLSGEFIPLVRDSIKWSGEETREGFLIEYLSGLAKSSAKEVATLYIDYLLPSKPTYPKEKIRQLVEELYAQGLKEEANKICGGYRGEFLQDLFKQHNP